MLASLVIALGSMSLHSEAATPKLNKKSVTIKVGKSVQLKVKGTKKKVKWSSSKKKICTVSSKGLVKAKKKGTATVKAKVGKKTLKCKVTVKAASGGKRGTTNLAIPNDASSYNGHKYKVYDTYYTWKEAKELCEITGGHLVTITSQKEQDFIGCLINNKGKRNMYWMGSTCEGDIGTWRWVTGEEFSYINWAIADGCSEPDNWRGISWYGVISNVDDTNWVDKLYGWMDMTNIGYISDDISGYWKYESQFGYICEWEDMK